jgi:hypothetical protein
MSPWIWLALDDPKIAEEIISQYPGDTDEDETEDHQEEPDDIDIDEREDHEDEDDDDHGDHHDD